jgi:hypothetical protein
VTNTADDKGRIGQKTAALMLLVWMLVVVPFAISSLRSSAAVHRDGVPSTAPGRAPSGGGGPDPNGEARFNPIVDSFIGLAVAGTVVAVVVTRRRTVAARAATRH